MDISDAVGPPRVTDAERRRPVRKDPLEFGVKGLRATLALNAKPRRWRRRKTL